MFLTVPPPKIKARSMTNTNTLQQQQVPRVNIEASMRSLLTESKQQLNALKSIQNGFYVANLYKRFILADKVLFILLLIKFIMILIYFQLQLKQIVPIIHKSFVQNWAVGQQLNRIKLIVNWILWSNLALTCLIIPASYFRNILSIDYEKIQKKQINSNHQIYQYMFILIQPIAFLNNLMIEVPLQTQQYGSSVLIKLNHILVILSLVKGILLARYFFWNNLGRIFDIRSQKFFTPSYNRICRIYTCEKNYIHIMKCVFKENFIVFITGLYLICMIIGAYALRVTQSYFDGRFVSIDNCLWLSLLSMTTIGFGDLYVSTTVGIIIDGSLMFAGVVIVSLLVSSLNDLFSMGYRQKRSLTLLKRLKQKGQLKELASVFIVRCLQRKWIQKKTGKTLKACDQQRLYCRLFHQSRMILRNGKQKHLNLYRDMQNQFQSLKLQLGELMDICEDDIEILSQKQRLTLNRQSKRSNSMRSRSSSYMNMIKLKSRDSRVSLMRPSILNDLAQEYNQMKKNLATVNNLSGESSSSEQSQQAQQFQQYKFEEI